MKRWGWALVAAFAVAASIALGWQQIAGSPGGHWIETNDAAVLAQGRDVYARHCASCHGANLEGQPDWTIRLPSGRLPAPPHDASGHTWHHPPDQLFGIVKEGVEKFAPAGYQSNMPAYGSTLSDDEIRSVLAWIRSTWPAEIKRRYAEIQARNR